MSERELHNIWETAPGGQHVWQSTADGPDRCCICGGWADQRQAWATGCRPRNRQLNQPTKDREDPFLDPHFEPDVLTDLELATETRAAAFATIGAE